MNQLGIVCRLREREGKEIKRVFDAAPENWASWGLVVLGIRGQRRAISPREDEVPLSEKASFSDIAFPPTGILKTVPNVHLLRKAI